MICHRKKPPRGQRANCATVRIAPSKVNRKLSLKQPQNQQTTFASITGIFLSVKSQDRFQPQNVRTGADRDPRPALFPPSLACRDCLLLRRRLAAAYRAPALFLRYFVQGLLEPYGLINLRQTT